MSNKLRRKFKNKYKNSKNESIRIEVSQAMLNIGKKCVMVESNEACNEFMVVLKKIISYIDNDYNVYPCMIDESTMAFIDFDDTYNEDEFDKVFDVINKIVEKLYKMSNMGSNIYC